jgi:hypothetical protein
MVRARVRLHRMNSPNFALRITGKVQNVTLVILRHGSLALNKVGQFLRRGIRFDIALPLTEWVFLLNHLEHKVPTRITTRLVSLASITSEFDLKKEWERKEAIQAQELKRTQQITLT